MNFKKWMIFSVPINKINELETELNRIEEMNFDIFKILKSIDPHDGQMKWNIVAKRKENNENKDN